MSMRDKIEHAIQNQPCTVKELKQKFGGERGAISAAFTAILQIILLRQSSCYVWVQIQSRDV